MSSNKRPKCAQSTVLNALKQALFMRSKKRPKRALFGFKVSKDKRDLFMTKKPEK